MANWLRPLQAHSLCVSPGRIRNVRTPTTCLLIAALAFGRLTMAQTPSPETSQTFVNMAAQSTLLEIELGKLARASTSSGAVKVFAARMIADNQRASGELLAIARSKGLTVPTELDATQASTIEALRRKSGAKFDKDYARRSLSETENIASLLRAVFTSGGALIADPDLTQFARSTLAVLREHKRLAEDLRAAN
jgi:putative membrane protein